MAAITGGGELMGKYPYNSSTPHSFKPNYYQKLGYNHNECGNCMMPRTHRVHPQADRGAMGHRKNDDPYTCYDESHWDKPVTNNEGDRA